MARFIELSDKDNNRKIAINPDYIVRMRVLEAVEEQDYDEKYGTVIELAGGTKVVVSNMYDDLIIAINGN